MNTPEQKAVILDLHTPSSFSPPSGTDHPHSSPTSLPSPTRNHASFVKTITDLLLNIQTPRDFTRLYILTSAGSDVSGAADQLVSSEGRDVQVTVVAAGDRIASFYKAKQDLDNLEVSHITVMCVARDHQFWTYVCQELFTPVHHWEVSVVKFPDVRMCSNEHSGVIVNTHSGHQERPVQNGIQNEETAADESRGTGSNQQHTGHLESSTHEDLRKEGVRRNESLGADSSGSSGGHGGLGADSPQSSSDALGADSLGRECCTAEGVRAEIRGFLKTLPSLLGVPEVERSRLLPGEGRGFLHGYSTRRGGVTSLATLCSMNLVYTDKKRDSLLVVEENRRRLSLAGGFDPSTFHIVKVEHGTRVWTVGEEDPPLKFDALVTNRRDVTLAAAGADCIPLLFADPVAMAIGAAHAGWMGSVGRVAQCVVKTMGERFGSRPEDIRVSMGPGLRLGCFRVLEAEGKMFADIHPSCQVDVVVEPLCHKMDKKGEEDLSSFPEKRPHPDDVQAPQILSVSEDSKIRNCVRKEESETPLLISQVLEESEKRSSSQVQPSTTRADGELKTRNGTDMGKSEIPAPTTRASEETRSPDVNTVDDRNPSLTTSSRNQHLLNDLRVEQVPAERLRPKTPRQRKSSQLQWTFVDLQMTNYHVLLQAGVKAEHIDMSTSHCTKCNPDLYFSYERDSFPFGNQIGFISMPSGASV